TTTDTVSSAINDRPLHAALPILTVTVTGVNDAPTATADINATDEDHSVNGNVLTNDTDPDVNGTAPDDALSVTTTSPLTSTKGDIGRAHACTTVTYSPRMPATPK